jgi:hypothetical protein
MLSPFARREAQSDAGKAPAPVAAAPGAPGKQEIDELRRQMEEMQQRLDQLSEKDQS